MEKQLTAVTQIINELQKHYYDESFPSSAKDGIITAIAIIGNQLNSLELEKQQLIGSMVGVIMEGHGLEYGIEYLGKVRDAEEKAERHFNEAYAAQ